MKKIRKKSKSSKEMKEKKLVISSKLITKIMNYMKEFSGTDILIANQVDQCFVYI